MPKWERRYLVHAHIVQLIIDDAFRRKHEIEPDDPDAVREREEIEDHMQRDLKEFNHYFWGKKSKETCAYCPYPDFYYRYQMNKGR